MRCNPGYIGLHPESGKPAMRACRIMLPMFLTSNRTNTMHNMHNITTFMSPRELAAMAQLPPEVAVDILEVMSEIVNSPGGPDYFDSVFLERAQDLLERRYDCSLPCLDGIVEDAWDMISTNTTPAPPAEFAGLALAN